jgi:hypothetical protein
LAWRVAADLLVACYLVRELLVGGTANSLGDDEGGFVLHDDNSARDRARTRRARTVYHGILLADLNDRGAASATELWLRLDLFLLPLSTVEIRQTIDSARRQGLVTENGADSNEAEPEWTATKAGSKLSRPRALALSDLVYRAAGQRDSLVKLFTAIKRLLEPALAVVVPLAALIGAHKLPTDATVAKFAVAGAGLAVLLSILLYGWNGELNLRAAAGSWPRLGQERSARAAYQAKRLRAAFVPLATVLLYGNLAALGLSSFARWSVGLAIVSLAVLASLALFWLRPLRNAWAGDRARCSQEWERRRQLVASGAGPSP